MISFAREYLLFFGNIGQIAEELKELQTNQALVAAQHSENIAGLL